MPIIIGLMPPIAGLTAAVAAPELLPPARLICIHNPLTSMRTTQDCCKGLCAEPVIKASDHKGCTTVSVEVGQHRS